MELEISSPYPQVPAIQVLIRFCKIFCLRIWAKLCFDDDSNECFDSVEDAECLDYETIG
jgi:hypothetical protein